MFDEHNLAYYYWHKARFEKAFGEPLDLFHIDAHEDMGGVKKLKRSIYFDGEDGGCLGHYKKIAEDDLGIGDFILPAVLNGIIKNVYFIFPEWRNSRPKRKQFNIASAFGEGTIIKHNLELGTNPDPRIKLSFPDLTSYRYTSCPSRKMPSNRKVILDIDLDYFACRDSITNHMQYELEITKDQFLKRNETLLSDKTLPFSGLDFSFIKRDGRYYSIVSHKKTDDISHLPSGGEIKDEIKKLVETLKSKKIRPAVVTICRSCISGYCPKEHSSFIEENLLAELNATYSLKGDANPVMSNE